MSSARIVELRRFAREDMLPQLGPGFAVYWRRDLVRLHGAFVQGVALGKSSRSDWVRVIPMFYVVGADPVNEVMFQHMSLPLSGIDRQRHWRVAPEAALDQALARRMAARMETESPLSFAAPLDDAGVDACLARFVRQREHWIPWLSRAFLGMCRGLPQARVQLDQARQIFLALHGAPRKPLAHDWQHALLGRLDELEQRLDRDDCIALCRADAESHAQRLRLPALHWPAHWPLAVPSWPPLPQRPVWRGRLERWLARCLPARIWRI